MGSHLIIKIDKQILKYMMSQRLTEGIQHKLLMKLLEIDYSIEYKKGKENRADEALSRKNHSVSAIFSAVPTWIADIEESNTNDPIYSDMIQQLVVNSQALQDYSLHSDILRYKGRICIGTTTKLRGTIIASLHSSAIGGHSGIRATYQRLKKLFYWPNMRKTVEKFVTECVVCQRDKVKHCHYPGLLEPLPVPTLAWSFITMDFVEDLPKSGNKNVILVVVDRLTKYAHFIVVAHPYTTNAVAQLFIDNIFRLHAPAAAILTDRDRIFTSQL
jgi:hypothetical protein